MEPLIARDWIDVKIDTDRMPHGEEVAKELRGDRSGGIPWMVILDADGAELVAGDGPGGNIGCPVTEEEAKWFFSMLKRTRQRLKDEELDVLRAEHDIFAKPLRRR